MWKTQKQHLELSALCPGPVRKEIYVYLNQFPNEYEFKNKS